MQDRVQFTLIYKWLFTLFYIHVQSDLVNANLVRPFKKHINKSQMKEFKIIWQETSDHSEIFSAWVT